MPFQDRRGQGAYTSGAASRDLLPSIGLPALALRLRDQRILGQDERPVSVFPELGLGVRLALPVAAIDGRTTMRAEVVGGHVGLLLHPSPYQIRRASWRARVWRTC